MNFENSDPERCPLCGSPETAEFERDELRLYLRCSRCGLVFVPADFHVSREEERARYDLHENSISDEGYTAFLGRVIKPLKERFPPASSVLDFGSGPNPVLARLLRHEGFEVDIYDSFFAANTAVFDQTFDVITLTEVLEHLSGPGEEIARLDGALRPGGSIAVMMRLLDESDDFSNWHYKNDPTHISFFSWDTCVWTAGNFGLKAERIEYDIVFFEKQKEEAV